MDTVWFEILVIVLGSFLAILLLLLIIVAVKIIQIVKVIKRIIDHAEQMADKAEHIASFFQKTAMPIALTRLVSNLSDVFMAKKGKK